MNVDKLISAVFKRPLIWDKSMKDYTNRNLVNKAWKEISKEMNIQESALRRKWKNLRDYFGFEISKRSATCTGDDAGGPSSTSKWQFFNQLLFLKGNVTRKKGSGSLGRSSLSNNDNETAGGEAAVDSPHCGLQGLESTSPVESVDPEIDNLDDSDSETTDGMVSGNTSPAQPTRRETPTSQNTRGKKRKGDSLNHCRYEKLLALEQQKIKLLAERNPMNEADDDDMLFLKSLLPFIKKIPEERKLSFRSRVQMLVDDFTHGKATNLPEYHHGNDHREHDEKQQTN